MRGRDARPTAVVGCGEAVGSTECTERQPAAIAIASATATATAISAADADADAVVVVVVAALAVVVAVAVAVVVVVGNANGVAGSVPSSRGEARSHMTIVPSAQEPRSGFRTQNAV